MLNTKSLLLLACAGLPACVAATMPAAKAPAHYTCTDGTFVDQHSLLSLARDTPVNVELGWTDKAGRHYVEWPTAVTDKRSVEYVIPADGHADAVVRLYDTSQGTAKQDWLLLKTSSCAPDGGYSDALSRFARGETMDDIRTDLLLADKSQARSLVHDAMINLQRRYFKDQ
jgi:hypothetical protein